MMVKKLLCARSALGLAAGESAVVTNGRVITLAGMQPLLAEDFRLLDQYASAAQVAKLVSFTIGLLQICKADKRASQPLAACSGCWHKSSGCWTDMPMWHRPLSL